MTPEEFDIQLEVGDITYRTYAVAPLDGFQSIKIDEASPETQFQLRQQKGFSLLFRDVYYKYLGGLLETA